MNSYTITDYQHGMAITGSIPLAAFMGLTKIAESQGYDLMDAGIASAIRADFVFVNKKSGEAWRAKIEKDTHGDWIQGTDTGTSSKTIYFALNLKPASYSSADVPYDPDDFGRCYRLLKRFPEWVARLPEVAEMYPAWKPLVREWAKLTKIYERDLPAGASPELFRRLTELNAEGSRAK